MQSMSDGHGGMMHMDGIGTCSVTTEVLLRLRVDLDAARAAVQSVHTVADAKRLGFVDPDPRPHPEGQAHYVLWSRMDATFEVGAPEQLLFAGHDDQSPLLAAVYYVVGGEAPPEGFGGSLDHWHPHSQMCFKETTMVVHAAGDPAGCAAAGGSYGTVDGWMVHAWVVPGVGNEDGVFAVGRQGDGG